MAKGIYVGAGGVARRMKKAYVGVAGKARAVRKMYVGVGIRTQLWTNVPGSPASDPSRVDATTAVSFGVLPPEVLQLYRQNHQAAAYPVRCVKE